MWLNKRLEIEGMSCISCEKKIQKRLTNIEGVRNVIVSYTKSNVIFEYDEDKVKVQFIISLIEKIGYTVLNEKKKDYKFIGVILILFSVYLIIDNTIGFNFIPVINQSMGYGMLFLIGILTSLHCVAMCGGINLSQSISKETNKISYIERFKPTFLYNLGRVVSYTIIGGVVGYLGQIFSFSGVFKGIVSIFAGVFMMIMGINMLNLFPKLRNLNIRIPSIVLKVLLKFKTKSSPFYIGLLNGLMPCGPLQSMQIYALGTGNIIDGALSMMFFSLGTIPLMLGIGLFSTYLGKNFTKQMIKAGAVLVLVLGVIMLNRGLNLSGVSTNIFASKNSENIAIIKGDKQIVKSEIKRSRTYPTITVKTGIPVEWEINTTDKDLNGCNNPITLPVFKIEKELQSGKNIISFTPEKAGKYVYTCWMGMISGTIIVDDNLN